MAEILTAPQVARVQAIVTVYREGLGWRDVAIDYVPGYGDPIAGALLAKALDLAAAGASSSARPSNASVVG